MRRYLTILYFVYIISLVIDMIISLFFRNVIKMFLIFIMGNYIYLKITNNKKTNKMLKSLLIVNDLILAIGYAVLSQYVNFIIIFVVLSMLNIIFVAKLLKSNNSYTIISHIFATLMAYVLYYFALIISGFMIGIFVREKQYDDALCVMIISVVYILIVCMFMSLKRIKNGFNFLHKINTETMNVIVFFGVMSLLLYGVIPKNKGVTVQILLLILGTLVSTLLFIVIRNLITKHYKNNMRERNIAIQKEEIDANVKIIEELKEQNLKLSTTIHKYNHRLSSLENSIRKAMSSSNTEFAKELSVVLEQTQNVASQFAQETKVDIKLPVTNVISVDNMMEFMRDEAVKCGIDFTFKFSDSIKPLLDKYISEDKFETLLADHIKDAIIAINAKSEGYKSIMVLIGVSQGAYEVSIYDTGIEFDISTLLKLGTEPITTHKDNGGSGLGFMTTFETLKSSNASLVIEEYDTRVTNYTKSVTIRFDNKCEYRIYSYRAEEIKKCCNGRKIIIKSI